MVAEAAEGVKSGEKGPGGVALRPETQTRKTEVVTPSS